MKVMCRQDSPLAFELNGKQYQYLRYPTVVICVDGCSPAYLEEADRVGLVPSISRAMRESFSATAAAVMPTFTNPNNVSIVTGAPPWVHGISGNYYLDSRTGKEIMITDASLLRSETILSKFSHRDVPVAVVTAKDKLRKVLGHNLNGIALSSERANLSSVKENGIDQVEELVGRPTPNTYSADLSLFVLDTGVRLLERGFAKLIYLSLSDYIQHKYPPGSARANSFYRELDDRISEFVELGATVGITADHGMNDKSLPDGSPNVVYLEDRIHQEFGEGTARVICPITDPYVRHHGALGSFVRVHVRDPTVIDRIAAFVRGIDGVEQVLDRDEACRIFELPFEHEGDLDVVATSNVVIGSRRIDHDLSALGDARLRSHGGLSEQNVPFILSRPLNADYLGRATRTKLRNFDIFDYAINGAL